MEEYKDDELGWESEIDGESTEYRLLPEGDYDFIVDSFERGQYNGGEKLPPCKMATVKIRIDTPDGPAYISHRLYLHKKVEGLLSAFFISLGLMKEGEKAKMNWPAVPGASGRCKVGIRTWINNDGEERQSNQIRHFYPKKQKQWEAGKF